MAQDNNIKTFLALLRAGLWGRTNDNDNENFVDGLAVNWAEVFRLAEEQSVVGLVTAGVEKLPAGTFFTESNSNQRETLRIHSLRLSKW